MKNFINEWIKIEKKINNKHLCIFLDFDGTLVPIRRDPRDVKLSKSGRNILKGIVGLKDVSIAIISGRALKEIKKLVSVKGITYAGNHGFELEGPGIKRTIPKALKTVRVLQEIKRELCSKTRKYKGVIVEDKGLTLSMHFRMAGKNKVDKILQLFDNITGPYIASKKIRVTRGKKVREIRPPQDWDKGKIVSLILNDKRKRSRNSIVPFYIGDDKTDEDAFRYLRKKGFTIRVIGIDKRKTNAEYFLNNTGEVKIFLKKVLFTRKEP